MINLIISFLFEILKSNTTKLIIATAIKKLLEHKKDGITKDLANILIDGIVESKHNPIEKEEVKTLKDKLKWMYQITD